MLRRGRVSSGVSVPLKTATSILVVDPGTKTVHVFVSFTLKAEGTLSVSMAVFVAFGWQATHRVALPLRV